jgi:hypothetical protein
MPRPAKGSILTRTLADGNRSYRLRFSANGERHDVFLHAHPGCECGCGGGWTEPAARTELGNILARVRARVWTPPQRPEAPVAPREIPTFHEYASLWLQRKIDGVTGDRPIRPNTAADYRSALTQHLLPYFARHRIDAIDRQACLDFKATKIREAAELREALDAGADLRDKRNRRLVPIGPSQLRKLIRMLAMILDDAIEDELIDQNPARGKRMRVRVPKPHRSFLELDELADLIAAATTQDALPRLSAAQLTGDSTAPASPDFLRPATPPSRSRSGSGSPRRPSATTPAASSASMPSRTSVGAPSSRSSPVPVYVLASCATSASATCACTTPKAPACTSATPRPTPASAKFR